MPARGFVSSSTVGFDVDRPTSATATRLAVNFGGITIAEYSCPIPIRSLAAADVDACSASRLDTAGELINPAANCRPKSTRCPSTLAPTS